MQTVRLAELPPHTSARGGLRWGAWDNKLAIVDRYPERFDAETLERSYIVRFAADTHTREPIVLSERAFERVIGLDVRVRDPRVPYEKTTFEIGNRLYNPSEYICGTFSAPVEYRVKLSLVDMGDDEHFMLIRSLQARGFVRIETKRSKKQIEAMLARSFTDLQDGEHETANEADRIVRACMSTSHMNGDADAVWQSLRNRGVFVLTRAGRVKFSIPGVL
jgi:hypothetical protein